MRVDMVQVGELSADHERLWREIRATHRVYASPFFSLDYVRVASRSRPCFVAIIEHEGRVRGFWPFEHLSRKVAVPVGYPHSDHHGPIIPINWEPSKSEARALLRAAGKHLYRFTALPAEQRLWKRYYRQTASSPILVFEKRGARNNVSSNSNQSRKMRRLAREVGNWTFDVHCADPKVFELLIAWKRAHCARTGLPDFTDVHMTFLRHLFETQTPELRGNLSVLWAGGRPIAAHFGPRSERVWHWWYPSYDTEYQRHSPGLLMLHQMLASAPALDVAWLDFGTGKEPFKLQFANDTIDVALGAVYSQLAAIPVRAKRAIRAVRESYAVRVPRVEAENVVRRAR